MDTVYLVSAAEAEDRLQQHFAAVDAAGRIAVAIVGVLIGVAGLQSDPDQATGLDGAFDAIRSMPGGVFVLVVIGIGFLAFGVYSFFRARYARL